MNERAREALVAAALKGVRQIKGSLSDGADGRCALGVLAESVFGECRGAQNDAEADQIWKVLGINRDIEGQIMNANDYLGWDFLTIARKMGNDDAVVNPIQEVTK